MEEKQNCVVFKMRELIDAKQLRTYDAECMLFVFGLTNRIDYIPDSLCHLAIVGRHWTWSVLLHHQHISRCLFLTEHFHCG